MEDLKNKYAYFEISVQKEAGLNLAEIFGNKQPVHLEIGSGRGEFLIGKAEQNPQINYLAIELKSKRIKTIMRKLDCELHKNVRVIRLFVDAEITEILPAESFEMIYIIHPDPWPKKRHQRRRLIQQDFIDVIGKLLKTNGKIRISTDHQEYAEWIISHFAARADFVSLYQKGYSRTAPADHIETYFEKIKRKEGFPPFFMEYDKMKK